MKKIMWFVIILFACSISGWGKMSAAEENDPIRLKAFGLVLQKINITDWFDRDDRISGDYRAEMDMEARVAKHKGDLVILEIWIVPVKNWKQLRIATCRAKGIPADQIKKMSASWESLRETSYEVLEVNLRTGNVVGVDSHGETLLSAIGAFGNRKTAEWERDKALYPVAKLPGKRAPDYKNARY